jgi:hypothetical protein
MSCVSPWHTLKFAHDAVTALLLAGTLTLMVTTLGAPADRMALHLTGTFLSTYYTDDPATTWSPPLDPLTPSQIADTYYGCLHRAAVGFATPFNCGLDDPDDYRLCIDSKTSSQEYRAQVIAMGIKDIVKDVQGDTLAISLTAYNALMQALSSPPQLLAVSAALLDQDTVYARNLYDLLDRASNVRGVAGCLSRVDQAPSAARGVAPLYSDLWDCAARVLHTDVSQAAAFQQCVPLSSWPALDVMQTPYSTALLGSYNRAFVLLVAMWLLTSFAVYTAWLGVETPPNTRGKPAALFARCGLALTVFCLLWNGLGAVIMVLVKAFGSPVNAGGFPMTVQTVFVTGLAALLGAGYFLRELWEQASPDSDASAVANGYALVQPGPSGASHASFMRAGLSGFVRSPHAAPGSDLRDMQYAPLLAPAWSDGWLLCDGLFLMGIVGTSTDVVTADLVRCFLLVVYAAAAHSAFVRLFYESYVNDVPSDDPAYTSTYNANKSRDERGVKASDKSRRGLRVMTLLANLAVFLFAAPFWGLVFWRYADSALICSYVALVSVVPAVAWFVYNICVDFELLSAALAAAAQMGFVYAALVRAVFVFVVATRATADGDANALLARMLALLE